MKVLVVCLVEDYGRPELGLSFEYHNLYLPMRRIASEVVLFDFYAILQEHGREAMNRRLVEVVRSERPDVSLFALFKDEFDPERLREIGRYTRTVAYFFDDSWRRDYFAAWAPRFDFATTPMYGCWRRYVAAGMSRVVYSPFAFNEEIYRRLDVPKRYDVSFVGGPHPWRRYVIRRLRKAGIDVQAFGWLWPNGRIDQERMIEVTNASKINLNISNSRQWDVRYLLTTPRALRVALRSDKDREQIKGRHFEIPGCGGFQLTHYCEEIERHFRIGDEIAIYLDVDDLIDKVRFYLENDDERERIAAAGYERALREHTATRRLSELLDAVMRWTNPRR